MKVRTKGLLLAVAIIVALLLSFPIRRALRAGTTTAVHSCVASVSAALAARQISDVPFDVTSVPDWRVLGTAETDELIAKIHPSDCSGSLWPRWGEGARKPGGPLLDPWGERFQVAIRRTPKDTTVPAGGLEFVVWSKGPDRRSDTADDIVEPYGAKVPTS